MILPLRNILRDFELQVRVDEDNKARPDSREDGKVVDTHERMRPLPNYPDSGIRGRGREGADYCEQNGDRTFGWRGGYRWYYTTGLVCYEQRRIDFLRENLTMLWEEKGRPGNEKNTRKSDDARHGFLESERLLRKANVRRIW